MIVERVAVCVLRGVDRLHKHGLTALGDFKCVYRWIANRVLGSSRTPAQVKHFIEQDIMGSGGQYAKLCGEMGVVNVRIPRPSKT